MAEIKQDDKIKTMAFYLPQFHTIPENNKWWGEGFTEWTNTKKAKPLFEGHYQPKTPLNHNYYDLSDVSVMEKQAELAKKYGLYGFCYYHYWFKNGKKLLEKPVENMLMDKKVNIPFCLCWANESWSRNWDGGNREVIIEQDYGTKKEWEQHFKYLLQFFEDERYITYEGKPLLLIYKPEQIPMLNKMIDYWKDRVREEGFPGLVIVRQFPLSYYDKTYDDSHIDYTIKFEPEMREVNKYYTEHSLEMKSGTTQIRRQVKNFLVRHGCGNVVNVLKRIKEGKKETPKKLLVQDYDKAWNEILNDEPYNGKLINGAFVAWDNTPRNICGKLYQGATPEKFEKYMLQLLKKESALNLLFINAWNEWAEGAYLEPDEKYGYGWLEALRNALSKAQEL